MISRTKRQAIIANIIISKIIKTINKLLEKIITFKCLNNKYVNENPPGTTTAPTNQIPDNNIHHGLSVNPQNSFNPAKTVVPNI